MDRIQDIRREDIELGDNVRRLMDEYETKCLAVSIRERGIEIPLELEPGTTKPYRLRDGFRRFAASGLVGLQTVPARVHPAQQSESERLEYQLTINCQRVDISPICRAMAIRRLIATGRSATETARKLGMSNTAVSNLLALLTLPEPIQQLVGTGKLAASTASEIARVKDPAKQMKLAGLAANGQLKRDAVSRTAKQRTPRTATVKPRRTPRATLPLSSGCSVTVVGQGLSLGSIISWLDELSARAKNAVKEGIELDAFIQLLRDEAKTQKTISRSEV